MNPEISSTERPIDAWAKSPELERAANAIQPLLQRWLEGDDAKRRPIKDILHGTFIGHPLHPLLTDVPIGAWTVTAFCDVLEIAGFKQHRDAADLSLTVGAAGAVAAATAGFADWSDTKDEPQRLGLLHAALNGAALTCYLASLAARRSGARALGIALSLAGYGVVSTAAYIGGELSLGMQLGGKHTAVPIEPSADFTEVMKTAELNGDAMHAAETQGIPLLLTRCDAEVRAVSGVCTHRGAPLAEGAQKAGCVTCPWHGSRFALNDGTVVEGPATFPLARFDVRDADGALSVRPLRA
jgi:nitrite reductase/ring-hydroxylating ferredoxin subunit/uncharacterized membrane protein